MKRITLGVASLVFFGLTLVRPGQAEVNVNLNVGIPVVPAPVAVSVPGPVVLTAAPEFIFPEPLGIYVAVDIPFDMFYVGGKYYLYKDNRWHRAPYYNGPWRTVKYKHLPPGLRKHKFERIRYYRDEEYRRYRDDRDNYRGRHFKPKKEWKEARKNEKRYEKHERKHDKEERKMEKHERKHDR